MPINKEKYDIIEINTKGNGTKWQNLFLAKTCKGGLLPIGYDF